MPDVHTEVDPAESRGDGLLEGLRGALVWEAEAATVRVSFVSESAAEMLGAPGQRWQADEGLLKKHVHPEDWGGFLETLYQAAAEGGVRTYEHRLLRLDGSTLWVQTLVQRSSHSNGALLLTGLSVDISGLKQREFSLRDAETLSRLLIENIRDYGVFMLTLDGSVATWTPGAQRLKGFRAEEVIGSPLSRFFPPEEVAKETPRRLLERAELERQSEYEGWLVCKGGKMLWANLTLSAVTDEKGRLRGYSNVARDLTERKRTEQALRESEEHFRLLVESQDYGVFMVSPTGVVESWNRGAQRLNGFRAHEIVGTPMSGLFPAGMGTAGLSERLLTQASRVGRADYEGWLARKGGETFWGLLTVSAVEDESGHLRGFSLLMRDVTERRRTEEELRRSEQYFRLLIDSVQDYGVFMLSTEGAIQSWNQGAQRLKGYRAQEIIGASISRFFPEEEIEKGTAERLIEQALLAGSATYEGWMVRKGGHRFWALLTLSAVEDEEGNVQGLSNVARDLTERMRSERARSFLAEVGRVLAGSLDFQTTLERVAQLATQELAQACIIEMAVGSGLQRVTATQAGGALATLVQTAVHRMPAGTPMSHGVARAVQTRQSELVPEVSSAGWVSEALGLEDPHLLRELGIRSYMCVPLTARGSTCGALVFVAAPGRQYAAEELLLAEELARRAALAIDNARLYEQAQAAVRTREEVLAIVSHDLRNPLGAIQAGAAQLLAETRGDEQQVRTVRTVERIRRASERMFYMIRDLLDFSSIQAGKLRIEVSEHEATGLVTEVIEMMQPLAADMGVRLKSEVDMPGQKVRCDRERVMQVLSNLIGNAIKFTGEDGAVIIRCRRERDRAVFSVSDTGPGISEEDRAHVFDRYWQAERRGRESLGLGLAISKALVESHGGSIWVESKVGLGTTFFFTLPAA
jgi:PAS domain S-box-containing protein